MRLSVYITSDIEVWPLHSGLWPTVPLDAQQYCTREIDAYFWGKCEQGNYGVPYQVTMLQQHGLKGTFFVDPMFSFALGLSVLRDVVDCIQSGGQRIELHLHPEWLTDPRCPPFASFRGPMIAAYDEEVQRHLIRVARDRLIEAGARPPVAFRAGGWGAGQSTLRALHGSGINTDASLSAVYSQSFGDLPNRDSYQSPVKIAGVVEVPMTRFDDGVTRGGRPLSLVGVSFSETRDVLERLHESGGRSAVVVLHSNEFVRTEILSAGRLPEPRRVIVKRFERLCQYLADNSDRYVTRFIGDHDVPAAADPACAHIVQGNRFRTAVRIMEQVISRWY